MANTYLSQTISSSTGKKFTLSMWVKRAEVGGNHMLFHLSSDSGNTDYLDFAIKNNDKLDVQLRNGSSTTYYRKRTNRLLRDVNAWYHIVWRFDSTNSTADDRWIMYINGERITDIDLDGSPSQVSSDYITPLNRNGATLQIGNAIGGSMYLEGCLSHVHFCDGYSYGADSFGSTDSTTGEWKINTSPSVSYGTNGFTILKDGNTITDQSSNSNDFTSNGAGITKTEDCPSNVFATLNPLDKDAGGSNTFSNGNNTLQTNGNGSRTTLGANSGKYYAEVKIGANGVWNGVQDLSQSILVQTNAIMFYPAGATMYIGGSNQGSGGYGSAWSSNDIMMIAMDLDATQKKVYFGKNGGWWNGSDYSASSPTTGVNLNNDTFYGYRCDSGSGTPTSYWNFGNGYFGSTQISSAGTNASGNGIFEFDCPNGYTALSTKGLNL